MASIVKDNLVKICETRAAILNVYKDRYDACAKSAEAGAVSSDTVQSALIDVFNATIALAEAEIAASSDRP